MYICINFLDIYRDRQIYKYNIGRYTDAQTTKTFFILAYLQLQLTYNNVTFQCKPFI